MDFDIFDQQKLTAPRIIGVAAGIVTNNEDPENLGRVKVMIPSISSEDESNWARVCTFMSGNERGAFFLPEVDDEVLVAFENGDINSPFVIGSLWNGQDKAPADNSDGENNIRIIRSRSGHVISLDDKDGEEKIIIKDKSEENILTFDTANKTVMLESGENIEIKSPDGKLSITAKELEIKVDGGINIESGDVINAEAGSDVNIKGSNVNIN